MAASLTRPSFARAVLVAACGYAWIVSSWLWLGRHDLRQGFPMLGGAVDLADLVDLGALTGPVPHAVLSVVLVVALGAFLLRRAELVAGLVVFGVLTVAAVLEITVRGIYIPCLELVLPGNLLAAWLTGLGVARARRDPDADAFAHEIVAGVLAATLVLAAGSKLWYGGLDWASGRPLTLIVYERSFGAAAPLRALRTWVAEHPAAGTVGALYTLAAEAGGALYAVPRLRKAVALSLVPLFGGLFVLMGILHLVWVALPLTLAWSPLGAPRGRAAPAPASSTPTPPTTSPPDR